MYIYCLTIIALALMHHTLVGHLRPPTSKEGRRKNATSSIQLYITKVKRENIDGVIKKNKVLVEYFF